MYLYPSNLTYTAVCIAARRPQKPKYDIIVENNFENQIRRDSEKQTSKFKEMT